MPLSFMDLLAYMLASGGDDDSLKFWFWLIVGLIYIIKKVVESLKGKEKEQEKPILETEDHHEKRVKEVIAEMRRTPPQTRQPRHPQTPRPPAPAHAPRPIASSAPVELPTPSVARKRRAEPEPMPDWAAGDAQQTAQNVMDSYVKATEEAQRSINSLSDAEQAALQRLRQEEASPRPEPAPSPAIPVFNGTGALKNSLRHSQALKAAILYQEILGRPRALRDFRQ